MRYNCHFLTGTRSSTEQFARVFGFRFLKYDQHVMRGSRIVVLDANGVRQYELQR
jgi:hypothetical protein